jgi:predicted alpha/beta-fold hydrolase
VICSKDDPFVPIEIYDHPAFRLNPALKLLTPEHGGHLGFLSRHRPRFWVDHVALDWIERVLASAPDGQRRVEDLNSVAAHERY